MKFTKLFALGGVLVASVLAPCGAALAAGGATVTVRIEGRSRTLLAPTTVRTNSGWITMNHAPRGACPATSAAGALDSATHHRWSGPFSTNFDDYLITSILGDRESSKAYYWGIWIDNKYATAGACEIKLHRGDRLLFAVDSVAHHEHPIELTGSSRVAAGHSFSVKVVWFRDSGAEQPLSGATVTASGISAVTNRQGVARITATHAGALVLRAARSGYIRAATVRVRVSG
jgi:Domain of unknown function (DUF4430)